MGLLNRDDARIHRAYFQEMTKLIGIQVLYQYVIKQELTIHSEDNSTLSQPIQLDILFDENPSQKTLNRMGWVSELGRDDNPIVINVPYNTPNLTVNARITIESTDGIKRPRVFKITQIQADLEYPEAFTCMVAPVYDQLEQRNQYTLVNHEKINEDMSKRTSKDQDSLYITSQEKIDTTPEEFKEWEQKYTYINDDKSPYSS